MPDERVTEQSGAFPLAAPPVQGGRARAGWGWVMTQLLSEQVSSSDCILYAQGSDLPECG